MKKKLLIFGINQTVYRFVYSFFSLAVFLVIYIYSATLDSFKIWRVDNYWKYVGMMLATLGVVIIARSFKKFSTLSFIGLKPEKETALIIDGIHGMVRHPIYSGTLLLLIGFFLYTPVLQSLILLLSTCIYLPFGIFWEEKKLKAHFKQDYISYASRVPALIPKFWKNRDA